MKGRERELVVLIILDGVGIGELPDAAEFDDSGSNTLGNLAKRLEGLNLPNLEGAGLGNIGPVKGIREVNLPKASHGKMAELSPGKDSTSGHWEMMGCLVDRPFPLFPDGFPDEIIERFEKSAGRHVIGNRPASGTEIIEELGPEHLRSGDLIVYTSADSVFQVAAHKEIVPLQELYEICELARELLSGEFEVARVIARPFEGRAGAFVRTPERKDLSVAPSRKTVLDALGEDQIDVWGIGKVDELFGGRGFSRSFHTRDNHHGIELTMWSQREMDGGLIFTNLIDFDMQWGHRNDAIGFYKGLQGFDNALPRLEEGIRDRGFLIITADHGCDPTTPSTDHSREYVPLLVFDGFCGEGRNLGVRSSYADVGATISRIFGVDDPVIGRSFLEELPSFRGEKRRVRG